MATYQSDGAGKAAYLPKTGEMGVQFGVYDFLVAPTIGQTVEYFDLPQKAVVLTGELKGVDLDTGTETLEVDIGTASDPDRWLNSGVVTGDAVAGWKPEVGIYMPIFGLIGGQGTPANAVALEELTQQETVIATLTAAPAAGGTGKLGLWFGYTRARS